MLLGKNVRLLSQKTRQLAKRSSRSARQTEIGRVSLSLPEIFVVFMLCICVPRMRKTGPLLALHLDFF